MKLVYNNVLFHLVHLVQSYVAPLATPVCQLPHKLKVGKWVKYKKFLLLKDFLYFHPLKVLVHKSFCNFNCKTFKKDHKMIEVRRSTNLLKWDQKKQLTNRRIT